MLPLWHLDSLHHVTIGTTNSSEHYFRVQNPAICTPKEKYVTEIFIFFHTLNIAFLNESLQTHGRNSLAIFALVRGMNLSETVPSYFSPPVESGLYPLHCSIAA